MGAQGGPAPRRLRVLARQLRCAATSSGDPRDHFTEEQRAAFYRDGFVVIRGAVPKDMTARARAVIQQHVSSLPNGLHSTGFSYDPGVAEQPDVLGLFEGTRLKRILGAEMGPCPPVASCQVAWNGGGDESAQKPVPHIDGVWSGPLPKTADEIDLDTMRPKDAERWYGKDDSKQGAFNGGLLWQQRNPDGSPGKVSLGSFTCLVGVALNDQSELAPNGQFAVLSGQHRVVEECFRRQRRSDSGVVGPEGLDWPRVTVRDGQPPGLNPLPGAVKKAYADGEAPSYDPSAAWPWPELTPVLLAEGDAVIALHAAPHCATPNLGPSVRQNVYFRIRRSRPGNPHEGSRHLRHGASDRPDVSFATGKQLEYPPHYDPFKTSVDLMCDHWSDWDGMKDYAAKQRRADLDGQ